MKNNLKLELWKAFHNSFFYISISVGLMIVTIDLIENFITVQNLTERTLEIYSSGLGSGGHSGFSLFVLSLPYNGVNYSSRLFLFIWPILAALPYGWSYCAERRNGTYNQIVTRSNKRVYFVSKYAAVFISGGITVFIPVVADILLNALICPYEVMDVSSSIASIFNGWFLSELYYTNPWIHSMAWSIVAFLLGGATASLCFLAGSRIRLSVLVPLVPFVLLVLWDMVGWNIILPVIPNTLSHILFSPLQMVMAASALPNPEWVVGLCIWVLAVLGFVGGYWQVSKIELV